MLFQYRHAINYRYITYNATICRIASSADVIYPLKITALQARQITCVIDQPVNVKEDV